MLGFKRKTSPMGVNPSLFAFQRPVQEVARVELDSWLGRVHLYCSARFQIRDARCHCLQIARTIQYPVVIISPVFRLSVFELCVIGLNIGRRWGSAWQNPEASLSPPVFYLLV